MQKRARRQRSGFGLISVLLGAACVMILAAAILPSSIRLFQVNNEVGAAQSLGAIASANFTYASRYGSFVAPSALVGNLANTTAQPCANPLWLLQASQASASAGYKTPVFLGGTAATTPPCTGINGFQSYQIQADPVSPLEATRHFLYDSSTSQIYFTTEPREATTADAIYQAPASLSVGSGSSNNPQTGTASNSLVTVWSATPTQNYVQGSEVLRSAVASGIACGSTNGPAYYGVYVNLTGSNGDPCTDAADWFYSGIGTAPSPVVTAPPPTSLSGSISFTSIGAQSLTGGDNFFPANVAQSSWPTLSLNTLNFTVSGPPPTDGYLRAQIIDQTTGADAPAWCNLNNATSCTSQNTLTVNHGDALAVRLDWFQCSACSNYSITSISWTLTP
jgi:hypothetical protein